MKRSVTFLALLFYGQLLLAANIIAENKTTHSVGFEIDQISLIGDWRFAGIGRADVCDGPAMEEYSSPFGNNDIHISKDTICVILYPCVMVEKWKYSIQADSLVDANTNTTICKIDIDGNTMRFLFARCIVQTFLRDTFDSRIVHNLIRDTVNAECLVGKMLLKKEYSGNNEEPSLSIHPVKMPKALFVNSSSEALDLLETKVVYIRVRGRKRLFHVTEINWEKKVVINKSGQLVTVVVHTVQIYPGKWWRGESFKASYSSH